MGSSLSSCRHPSTGLRSILRHECCVRDEAAEGMPLRHREEVTRWRRPRRVPADRPATDGAGRPHPLDERRARLRRRLGRADRGDPAEHRGDRAGGAARAAEGGGALAADRLRVRPGDGRGQLHRVVAQGRPRRAGSVRAGGRGVDPERGDQVRGLLVRVRQQPGDRAADDDQRVAGPAGAQGARGARGRAPAPPTAASTRWPATRPARWACPTTWAGTGGPRRASRSCACRAARSIRTTCPRPSCTCCTRSPGRRR